MNNKLVYLLFFYLRSVWSLDSCEEHNSCSACILDTNSCVWCASNDYTGEIRCKDASADRSWCPDKLGEETLQNPENFSNETESRNFSSTAGTVTQIKPQRYKMKLRPGQPLNFSFSFKGAQNYPVDVYFLFDASLSMTSVKNHTAENSERIFWTMKNMTDDVYFGMGSFIDKNTLPFTLNVTDNLAYSFRHHLSLTNDYKTFQKTVRATAVGQNRDEPEGGLDALAQAIVCQKRIGWRNESRKILVLLTDGPYHAAGDGRSGGIFKPYDGECYTDDNGAYTQELNMDYPSVSMINKLAKQNEIIIIFGVTYKYQAVYQNLANNIRGAKMVELDVKKENGIVTILKEIYEKISKKIKLKVNTIRGRSKNFLISFNPNCEEESADCNIINDKEQTFNGTIKLLEYDGNNASVLDIIVEGLNEKLTLEIDVIKDCNCSSYPDYNSTYCNKEKRECGACVCSERKYGNRCACDRTKDNKINNNSTCYGEGMKEACNGSGICICGSCVCYEGFKGSYCECSTTNCKRDAKGNLCSGQGECMCDGKCKCKPEWSGDACQCQELNSIKKCKTDNGAVCNNRGQCECGVCKCKEKEYWDKREQQSVRCVMSAWPRSHEIQCKILNDCVLYQIEVTPGPACNFTKFELLDMLPEDVENSTEWSICPKVRVDVGCYTNFAYKYDENEYKILVRLQKGKDCAKIYYWTGGIILLTLLLGGIITLVVWKLCTYYRDRQEYLKFINEHKDDITKPSDNPLYEPATTTFRNPAFRKRSTRN